ncbi:hypothetical protein GCM10010123_01540 [Pilimelia anulata]|uniref:Uncharacterized protein n=1 Tax=Pilimelia anulata TaxID=53371 RepID=A0A8J3B649_9ACTN|nr:hypothetical protein [Pilimelia anulata]GGJ75243.1 hypothetical protein GCM10010123_01540 [Pilimelia anulata]
MADPENPIARLRPGGRGNPTPRPRRPAPGAKRDSDTPQADPRTLVREWHAMTPTERRTAWVELVDWVTWLHDRYELATEHRLPHCWPQHPGLIEELWALKAWRHEIYTSTAPSGQAARYWHSELRIVLQNAATAYAQPCRAGHRAPGKADQAAPNAELRGRWLSADPLAAVPANLISASAEQTRGGQSVPDAVIHDALHRGDARPLGQQVADFIHYDGFWWTPEDGAGMWLQISDPVFAADLDRSAERLAEADHAVEQAQQSRTRSSRQDWR